VIKADFDRSWVTCPPKMYGRSELLPLSSGFLSTRFRVVGCGRKDIARPESRVWGLRSQWNLRHNFALVQ
jgi:hypothetical protein